ncbi:hypothetical protein H310_06335 [Aphanomyces invadans]|uniref:DDE Tnp4 domain-containing protein n=1 Tax=Aphanomyces invadans TaxID=157072 RepID=A0A024U675_9STRA|nr:hypothetical protein H310_06335 [Aphanomyces invadans]ETW01730.1 hypothetical protein H310_06335 [Aphanomyces invadans]|eukprot:XP_008869578.1 hypothetical protein H310_06335 [Aphanomyces invadans]
MEEMSQIYLEHSQQVEEADDSPTPIMDHYYFQGGNNALATMVNLNQSEFETVWAIVESVLDAHFMTLAVLKHYNAWDKHALNFGMKAPPTFAKMVQRVLDLVEPVLFEHYVKPPSMTEQVRKDHDFENFPSALYCTDVKFQPSYRPTGRFDEAKHYFSGKHKLYGLKLEVSVAYPGFAVAVSDHSPGSVSDVSMFYNRGKIHRKMLRKSNTEMDIADQEDGVDRWHDLTPRDLERSNKVSSDRVLVENYFGRMCSLWKIMSVTYKWNESKFDQMESTIMVYWLVQ